MLPSVHDARYVRAACRIRVQSKSSALPIILLTAALDFAAATGANGQTTVTTTLNIPPNPATGFPVTLGAGSTVNVGGNTTIDPGTTGNIFNAPTSGSAATLNINSGLGAPGPITIIAGPPTAPTAPMSSLVVNGGGTGQPFMNNNTPSAINVDITGSGVNLSSSGQAVIWLNGPAATLTATGSTGSPGDLVFSGTGRAFPNNLPNSTNQEATAITVQNGAMATLTNATLNFNGPPAFQQAAESVLCVGACGLTGSYGSSTTPGGIGGTAILNNVVINDSANTSAGLWVSRTGEMMMTGGSINLGPGAVNGQGVHADINGRPILNNVAITTMGDNSVGAVARTFEPGNAGQFFGQFAAGIITLNAGSSITTTGADSTGALAAGAGIPKAGNSATGAVIGTFPSEVIFNGTADMPANITTMGLDSTALSVCACGQTLNLGVDTFFLNFLQQVGGTITAANTNVTTMMGGSTGVSAQDGGTIELTNSTVTINGSGGAGYFVNGIGVNSVSSNITTTDTVARTLGANSPGGLLTNGGTLTINGGSVTTTGAGSDGFLFMPVPSVPFTVQPGNPGVSPGDPTQPNTLTISNATVASAADAFHVTGVPANITVTGSTVTDNNGVLLTTEMGGVTNLTATSSQLSGAILTDPPIGTANTTLSTANVTLQGSTTWTMTGSSNLTTLTNNASNIIFTPPISDPTLMSSYKTLTVMMNAADPGGDYTGVNGRMTLNTFLGADNSPSDQLIINGGLGTGTTTLTINNTTGPGALTTMNGIPVVVAVNGGTTTPAAAANGAAEPGDTFSLANEVRAGAWDYRLFRGGPVNSEDPSVENSWFLRSTFRAPPVTPEPPAPPPEELVPPPLPGEPPITELPSTPPPNPLPPDVLFPIIGPELATYGVVQPLARELGLSILGTAQRPGRRHLRTGCLRCPASGCSR